MHYLRTSCQIVPSFTRAHSSSPRVSRSVALDQLDNFNLWLINILLCFSRVRSIVHFEVGSLEFEFGPDNWIVYFFLRFNHNQYQDERNGMTTFVIQKKRRHRQYGNRPIWESHHALSRLLKHIGDSTLFRVMEKLVFFRLFFITFENANRLFVFFFRLYCWKILFRRPRRNGGKSSLIHPRSTAPPCVALHSTGAARKFTPPTSIISSRRTFRQNFPRRKLIACCRVRCRASIQP